MGLSPALRLACAVVTLAITAGPARGQESPAAAIDAGLERISRARGRPFRGRISREELGAEALAKRVRAALGPELRRLESLAPGWAKLGLLAEDWSSARLAGLVSGSARAFYDPATRRLAVLGEPVSEATRRSLLHQLCRAFVDAQRPVTRLLDGATSTDERLARRAQLAGEALALLLEVLELDVPGRPADEQATRLGRALAPTAMADTPRWIREQLTFPYAGGLLLVRAALATRSWSALNALAARPPASTEQVLHPAKYFAGEAPVRLPARPLAALPPDELPAGRDDTLGELGLRTFLAELGVFEEHAAAAAEGWAGDRIVFYGAPAPVVTLWLVALDSEADAIELESVARSALEGAAGERLVEKDDERVVCRLGGRVVMVLGTTAGRAGAACQEALGWASGPTRAPPRPRPRR
jgi:hypothetical protein